jgi:predicted transcriptional regulator
MICTYRIKTLFIFAKTVAMNFTSSLPAETLNQLDLYAKKLRMPKNRVIEKALNAYFERLKKAEYELSFKKAAKDEEMLSLAEEGLEDYLKMLTEQ